jgi:hydrogenase maturation factor
VRDAEALLAAGGVTALHDPTEGGLAMGARELAEAAGCGVEIRREDVPLLPETAAIAGHLGLDPLGMLASGSLLAAARPESVPDLLAAAARAGIAAVEIGRVVEAGGGCRLLSDGDAAPLPIFPSDEVSRALAGA